MKTKLISAFQLVSISGFLLALTAFAQPSVPPPRKATPAEVSAGVNNSAYATPYSIAASGISSNGITAAGAEAVARGSAASGTNTFAGDGGGLTNLAAANLMTNGIVYVATNGVDALGNGRFDAPFRSLTYALTNSSAGSTIQIGVGNFAESDLHVTNRNIIGTDRYASHLVYSNASFGLRLYGTNSLRNLTMRPSYTNQSLTYTITPLSGTLTVENCELYGQSDVFFFYDSAATLNVVVRKNNILTPWDGWNGYSHYDSKFIIQDNTWTFYNDASITQAKQWLRNINGQEMLVTGNKVRMTGGSSDNAAIVGSDLSRLYLFGNDIESEDLAVSMSDAADLYYPFMVGRLSGTHSNKFRNYPVRTSELRLHSPWQNDAAIVATNTSVAYAGDTKGVGGAGTTAVNGLYVLQYDNHLHDANWALSEAVWTNTSNPRLKLIRADTNEINYLYPYQIFTNGNASTTAPSTSWTLLYSTFGWNDAWSADGGTAPAPTAVTNYAPTLKFLAANSMDFLSGITVAGTKIALNADGGASFANGASGFDTGGGLSLGGGNLGLYSTGDIEGPGLAYTITASGDATFTSVSGNGSALSNIKPAVGTNSTAVTPNISLYLTNFDGTVYRISAQKL